YIKNFLIKKNVISPNFDLAPFCTKGQGTTCSILFICLLICDNLGIAEFICTDFADFCGRSNHKYNNLASSIFVGFFCHNVTSKSFVTQNTR
ncbi:hypothetical protein BpHYR1_026956, partial [Brachionus plicatilis]